MSRARVRVRDVWPGAPSESLPPGQHLIRVFPRFGSHFSRSVPNVSRLTSIKVTGAVTQPAELEIASLANMPRREMRADFHCVAGWSFKDLRWGGVPFRAVYKTVIEPVAGPGVSHLRFVGLDGFRSVLTMEDALSDDVMLADHLDGAPLSAYHGGPVRLVSPRQYGYKNNKYVSVIELHTTEPQEGHIEFMTNLGLRFVEPHPRARVAAEERHRYLPAWSVRWIYRNVLLPVFAYLGARGEDPPSVDEDD